MQQITAARPQPDTRTHGSFEITAQITVDGGYSINTLTATGGTRIPELCIATADRDTYRLAYAVIREGGINNVHPDGVRAALTDALVRELHEVQARHDLPSRNRVEHINALLDRLESPADTAAIAELTEAVRRNLAETVPAGTKPQVARSRSNVERQPLTPTQARIVAGHTDGIIRAGKGVGWLSLRSMVRRGYADVVTQAGQKITTIRLNERGINAVNAAAPTAQPPRIAVHNGSRTLVANTRAAGRYADDITWQPIGQVEDDDTHIIATIDGEPQAIDKTHSVVFRVGDGPTVKVNAAELLNVAVA